LKGAAAIQWTENIGTNLEELFAYENSAMSYSLMMNVMNFFETLKECILHLPWGFYIGDACCNPTEGKILIVEDYSIVMVGELSEKH
jgi:hypothetical protein